MNDNPNQNQKIFVVDLHRLSAADIQLAGGKGANLGELLRAGFKVPEGFVITTAAYDHFINQAGLQPVIDAAVQREKYDNSMVQGEFDRVEIPPELIHALQSAYDQMGQGAVAVRSSANAEDLPGAAFAGQQDTYLNVVGIQSLIEAVRKCWASLWNDRAVAYRQRQGVDNREVKIAVVVQKMVAAEAAGVMFTANPVTGARDEILVDASPGLGEAVVSGRVTPDHAVIERKRGRMSLKSLKVGRQELLIQVLPGGGTQEIARNNSNTQPALSPRMLIKLAKTASAIERHFGRPQDIEWALSNGDISILQSRPLTALPADFKRPAKPVHMLAAMFAEMFPIRPYPLDMTGYLESLSQAVVVPIFSLIGIKPPSFSQVFAQEDGVVSTFKGDVPIHPTPALLLTPFRLLYLASCYDPARWREDPLLVDALTQVEQLNSLDIKSLGWQELLAEMKLALELPRALAGEMRRRYMPRPLLAAGMLFVVLKLFGQSARFGTLLSGVESDTTRANQALEELARSVRTQPELARIFTEHTSNELLPVLAQSPAGDEFSRKFKAFLNQYGHRETVLSTALEPTWKDAPNLVLDLIRSMASVDKPPAVRPSWQLAEEEMLASRSMKFDPVRSSVISLLGEARWIWRLREDTHFAATTILPFLHRASLELGQRLCSARVIEDPAQVFYLTLGELEQLDGVFPPAREIEQDLQRKIHRRAEKRRDFEKIPLVDPRYYQPIENKDGVLLQGTPGSPGIVEGRVRLVHDMSEFGLLQPGEVLVAPYTNPAWTILFQTAAAVIVDGGAAGSHAAIVAREYGIPAVMGAVNGTHTLKDGDWVRVDGTHGVVLAAKTHNILIEPEEIYK